MEKKLCLINNMGRVVMIEEPGQMQQRKKRGTGLVLQIEELEMIENPGMNETCQEKRMWFMKMSGLKEGIEMRGIVEEIEKGNGTVNVTETGTASVIVTVNVLETASVVGTDIGMKGTDILITTGIGTLSQNMMMSGTGVDRLEPMENQDCLKRMSIGLDLGMPIMVRDGV